MARGLLLWACVPLAQAQGGDDAFIREWLDRAQAFVKVPQAGKLPPDLQLAADEVAAQVASRLEAEAPRWLAELNARLGTSLSRNERHLYLWQRLYNELALWYMQPLTPELTEGWIAAATDPGFCRAGLAEGWFRKRMLAWPLVPAALHGPLLQAESEAAGRFGDAPLPPPRPTTGAVEAAGEMVVRMRRGQAQPVVPMTPVVAGLVLADLGDDADLERLNALTRCALNQWWLRESLAQAGTDREARAAALQAFRFDAAPDGNDLGGKRSSGAPATDDAVDLAYPRNARLHDLTGEVLVRVAVDDLGQASRARVVGRRLAVPGFVGRPVVFETLLDRAALHRLRGLTLRPAAAGQSAERTVELVFKLE